MGVEVNAHSLSSDLSKARLVTEKNETVEDNMNDKDSFSVKDSLKNKIILRRRRQGLKDIRVDFTPRQNYPMTKDEIEKDNKRRQSNRLSAKRCRLKQKEEWVINERILQKLKKENETLVNICQKQQMEKRSVMARLMKHTGLSESRIIEIVAERIGNTSSNRLPKRVHREPDSLPMANESNVSDGFIPNLEEISEESLLEELQLTDNYLLQCDYHTKLKTVEVTTDSLGIDEVMELIDI